MKKKRLIAGVILVMLAAASTTLFDSTGNVPLYRTDKITRGSIAEIVTANGTLNPLQLVNVGTQVSGQVSQVYVQVNDTVKAGQILAEIDPSLLLAQLKQSKASLETLRTAYELSSRNLERTRYLVSKDYVAKVELETSQQAYMSAKNSYESAKSAVEKDELNLGYTKITSPINGVVISQEITLGQTVAATYQTPNMFKIAGDLTKMKIDVSLPESDIAKVKNGMPATFTVDAFPDRTFNGKISMVNLNPNNQSGVVTYTVTVAVENPEKLLLPGMTAYVSITLSEVKDVLRVPAAALRFTPPQEQGSGIRRLLSGGGNMRMRPSSVKITPTGSSTIYLLKDGELKLTQVKTGATDDTYIEISGDDIAEGDTVVTGLMSQRKK
jgi:HlyD family secretion protein